MNSVSLFGRVSGQPYFDWREAKKGRQAFLVFYLGLRGPRKEGPTHIRIVVYGRDAEFLYPQLSHGVWVAVEGRYRERENPKALEQAQTQAVALIREFDPQLDAEALAQHLCGAMRDKMGSVSEIVASPNKIRAYSLAYLASFAKERDR